MFLQNLSAHRCGVRLPISPKRFPEIRLLQMTNTQRIAANCSVDWRTTKQASPSQDFDKTLHEQLQRCQIGRDETEPPCRKTRQTATC
ncbi:hypothetical protein BOA8489_00050 [Boseongicola aestuarii]|uniref:Uncharacterized protein n=1 Tax=Boseongicola aestuarii TaxID=1470561 RepID=A0A238IVE2_9RHOB|nr:hypothetical protein BOA8489_00050 [Boseongicola aestuarii]